jgi:glutaminyl-peptide cyclotransferase
MSTFFRLPMTRLLSPPLVFAALATGGCRETPSPEAVREGGAPVVAAQVLRSFPHDPAAFTQGLIVKGDTLIESTGGQGSSTLRRALLENGQVVQRLALPNEYFGEGAAVLGGSIYQLTWQQNTMLVVVTHSAELAKLFPRRLEMNDGRLGERPA